MRVFVDVPEADAAAITDDAKATVRVQVLRGREFPGAVTRTAWSLDSKSHTLRTEIDLTNGDGMLRPGMYAYATITSPRRRRGRCRPPRSSRQPTAPRLFSSRTAKRRASPCRRALANATHVEILKWQSPQGWIEPTGSERFVLKAAGVADGQAIEGR